MDDGWINARVDVDGGWNGKSRNDDLRRQEAGGWIERWKSERKDPASELSWRTLQ